MKQTDPNKPITNQVVYATIGAFDGVHIGHQQLIYSMVKQAKIDSAKSSVITFHPHPAVLLRSISMPFYITSPTEKAQLFKELGVDFILDLTFNDEMAGLAPEHFMGLLLGQLPIERIWLGKDFALGKHRAGNLSVLNEIGKIKGYSIVECQHLEEEGEKISSSKIRNWIQSGDFLQTSKALNRYYSIEGIVSHGDSRGRTIGFPTANLEVWEGKILPGSGVYATWMEVDNVVYPSVSNVGVRPTFENQKTNPRVETFILNFDQDIYQNQVKLHFVEKIRSEFKFSSVDLLIDQIQSDVRQTEEILKNVTKPTGLST
ncbi:MAG: bifunctional riboflavin kinase/FAD synthetase [Anaerolineaceae bacterium]|nr:bifunctional riboflavin kinase/FAD synthetase [Anaerolineaceae bacterium]